MLRRGCFCGIILYHFNGISAPIFGRRSGCSLRVIRSGLRCAFGPCACGCRSAQGVSIFCRGFLRPRGIENFYIIFLVQRYGGIKKLTLYFCKLKLYLGGYKNFHFEILGGIIMGIIKTILYIMFLPIIIPLKILGILGWIGDILDF